MQTFTLPFPVVSYSRQINCIDVFRADMNKSFCTFQLLVWLLRQLQISRRQTAQITCQIITVSTNLATGVLSSVKRGISPEQAAFILSKISPISTPTFRTLRNLKTFWDPSVLGKLTITTSIILLCPVSMQIFPVTSLISLCLGGRITGLLVAPLWS